MNAFSTDAVDRAVKRWASRQTGWAIEDIDGVQLVTSDTGIQLEVWNYYPSIEATCLAVIVPVADFIREVLAGQCNSCAPREDFAHEPDPVNVHQCRRDAAHSGPHECQVDGIPW